MIDWESIWAVVSWWLSQAAAKVCYFVAAVCAVIGVGCIVDGERRKPPPQNHVGNGGTTSDA